MRPIILQGHTRAITQLKYNKDGDLIFSAAKDTTICLWYSCNGERVGTYDGHKGTVWSIDVDWKTGKLVSGSGDMTIRLWDCQTGKELNKVDRDSPVRTSLFSYSGNMIVYSTDAAMSKSCEVFFSDVREPNDLGLSVTKHSIDKDTSKVKSILWGPLDETVVTGHEDGKLSLFDLKTNKVIREVKEHNGSINDVQASKDGSMFVTASKDHTAKLFDSTTLECLKIYKTNNSVNSAAISPTFDHVLLGGGQDAMRAAQSKAGGDFESRFFHISLQEEFARVKGHFGPINSLKFHPNGKQYTSGAEDGFLRVHNLDESYFAYKPPLCFG